MNIDKQTLIAEYATEESTTDTVKGLLLLNHLLISSIRSLYGSEELNNVLDDVEYNLSSKCPSYSPESLLVASSTLRVIESI